MLATPVPEGVERWEASGGTWRILNLHSLSAHPSSVTVELLRCDGGEVADRLTLRDAAALAWAREHSEQEDAS